MTNRKITANSFSTICMRFANNQSGASAIEYALIAAGISTAILASVTNVGTEVVGLFTAVADLF